MKHKILTILITLLLVFLFANCSEVKNDITEPAELEGVHGNDILDSESPNFHGKLIGDAGFEPCAQCHDANFSGGTANENCIDCHPTISVHKEGMFSPSSPNFHGKFLADNKFEMSKCKTCHGTDYLGGVSSPSCESCHSGISVHKTGIISPSSPDFHGNFIKNNNWTLVECITCHGEDYSGGLVSNSCNTCHSGTNGPESCNTCHGDFSDESKIAPPKDLDDNTQTTAKGVGAHSSHLFENMLSSEVSCYECHPQLESTDNNVFAHIDGLPAEMNFGAFASSGLSAPIYNFDLSCANTYCHGNFSFSKNDSENQYAYSDSVIIGNNFIPIWNVVDGTQAACGSCHGRTNDQGETSPLPIGHFGNFQAEDCKMCHGTTFNEDGSLNKFNHINGEPNLN